MIYGKIKLKGNQEWEETDAGFSTPNQFIPELIEFYKEGKFPFDKFIQVWLAFFSNFQGKLIFVSKYYDFEQIVVAFEDFESGNVIKPVLIMDESA